MATLIAFTVLCLLLVAGIVVWAASLRVGLNWRLPSPITWRMAGRTAVIAFILSAALFGLFRIVGSDLEELTCGSGAFEFLVQGLLAVIVIRRSCRISESTAIVGWLATVIGNAALTVAIGWLILPWFECFKATSSAMSPTVVGDHHTAVCPRCGAACYSSRRDEWEQHSGEPSRMICENFHIEDVTTPTRDGERDRVLVMKFLTPARWDLIVYRHPELEQIHLMRVVGMPGETITIQDGTVLANGVPLTPPHSMRNIQYVTTIPGEEWASDSESAVWGSDQLPAVLGADEYFVLGDFTERANDSRYWTIGEGSHPAYALPKSNIVGVVTHIYRPFSRWRAFR